MKAKPKAWVGIDAGKDCHWAVMLDADGEVLFSRSIENDAATFSALIEEALSFGSHLTWAIDQPGGTAALALDAPVGKTKGSSTFPASPR